MERAEWLKRMRSISETMYDKFAPLYWVEYGLVDYPTHYAFLDKFLKKVAPGGPLLSAGCGAGRYDGLLSDAGHPVMGIDLSEGMLKRAQEHFPQVRYQKMALQEMAFHEQFDGVICVDAMEHIFPEDYPHILRKFQEALKPGGMLYFTVENSPAEELETAYQRAKALGLPVVYGELVDEVDTAYAQTLTGAPDAPTDGAAYHFYPALEQVREWLGQAGLKIEEEGSGSGYDHFMAQKKA